MAAPAALAPAKTETSTPGKRYDVFLSHRYRDREAVEALHHHIEDRLGYSVYLDWKEQPHLDRSKVEKETAEFFRRVMRQCSCLVFFASPNAPASAWMPWELGFFDGRHGARRIAVFTPDRSTFKPGPQEYLNLYEVVDMQTLEDFLLRATDDTAAMTGATIDQWLRHQDKLVSDPIDYLASVVQWCLGVSANQLLDPSRMQIQGDDEPSGPLREPAALYELWYHAWRAGQAQIGQWRIDAHQAKRRASGLPLLPPGLDRQLQDFGEAVAGTWLPWLKAAGMDLSTGVAVTAAPQQASKRPGRNPARSAAMVTR